MDGGDRAKLMSFPHPRPHGGTARAAGARVRPARSARLCLPCGRSRCDLGGARRVAAPPAECTVLRELGGLSYHELGLALGVSHSAVESLLFRARQQVRALVAGANSVAVPLALRDELTRPIPGFDPGSASVVARLAAVPVAWKFASTLSVSAWSPGRGGLHGETTRHRSGNTQPSSRPSARLRLRRRSSGHRCSSVCGGHRTAVEARGSSDAAGRSRHAANRQRTTTAAGPGPAPAPPRFRRWRRATRGRRAVEASCRRRRTTPDQVIQAAKTARARTDRATAARARQTLVQGL